MSKEAIDQSKGWINDKLSNVADYYNGVAFKPEDWAEDGLPIIRIEQITNDNAETDKFNGFLKPCNKVDNGDLIFSWSATLKVVVWSKGPGALNQHLYKVVPKVGMHPILLRYILEFNMDKLAGLSQGSTMKHVTRRELSRFDVAFPINAENQLRIATILQIIGQAIERTEALIKKYQQIKAGVMHDLFTRGITADGKLRPPKEQAPELYKETPIGWIPKDWEVRPLSELTSKIVDGVHHTPNYVEYGIPFVTVKNLTASSDIDFSNLNYIDEKTHRECYARADPKAGDVLVTKDGTLGVCRIVKDGMPEFSIFVSVALLRVTTELTAEWLHFFFESGAYLTQLGFLSSGTGLKHIHLEHFRKFQISLPSLKEQALINKKVSILEDKVATEKRVLIKLMKQKMGLMHDLLTGKVPVKVNETEAAHV